MVILRRDTFIGGGGDMDIFEIVTLPWKTCVACTVKPGNRELMSKKHEDVYNEMGPHIELDACQISKVC